MTATTLAAAKIRRRGTPTIGKTVMRVAGSVAASMVSALCVAAVASALEPPTADDIAGRWQSDRQLVHLTLDVSRCGSGWCGVEVKPDQTCGHLALRLAEGQRREHDRSAIEFRGRFEFIPGAQAYIVRATIHQDQRGPHLMIVGSTDDDVGFLRRRYPFQQLMARTGDAQCRADPKTS